MMIKIDQLSNYRKKKEQLLNEACNARSSHLLIVGDFNFKEIRWDVFDTTVNEDHAASIFLESIKDTDLIQHIKENTRYRSGIQLSLRT